MQKQGVENPRRVEQRHLSVVRPQPTEIPLSSDELARFGGLRWVFYASSPDQTSLFGVREVKLGDKTSRAYIRKSPSGELVKRIIEGEDAPMIGLTGAGLTEEARTVYISDSAVTYATEDNKSKYIKVTFHKDVILDKDVVERAEEVALDFSKTVRQDTASRQIRDIEITITDMLDRIGDASIAEKFRGKLNELLEESAVETELIEAARSTLPNKIRVLADIMEGLGIKCLEDNFNTDKLFVWPAAIRASWKLEEDDWSYQELRLGRRLRRV